MVSCKNCHRKVTFILKHLAKSKFCKKSYSEKDLFDLRKASRKKILTDQRYKQNLSYDSEKRSKKYHEEKQRKSKTVKQNNANTVTEVKLNFKQPSNEDSLAEVKSMKVSKLKCSSQTVKQINSNAVIEDCLNCIKLSDKGWLENYLMF